jgi:uncharacterized protein YjbJ (UPF0337 family)
MGSQDSKTEQAKDQAKHVAGVAGDEAKSVAGDVREQARGLLDETRTQVQDQSRTQRDRLVETLRTFSDDLDGMAQQSSGLASNAAREVADRARSLTYQLDGREPSELLDDLRSFARRRPGMFLAGAAIAGVVVGRVLRGTRDAVQGGTQGTQGSYSGAGGYGYDVGATEERSASYDPTATVAVTPAVPVDETYQSLDEPLGTSTYPSATPGVTPSVTSTESGRPTGGS